MRGVIAALCFLVATASCTPGEGPSRLAGPTTPVVILSLDTLRGEVLEMVDAYGEPIAPNLLALAAESLVFPRAQSEMPFTLTAHMSLLTGLRPNEHRVFGAEDRLPELAVPIAETLQEAGYRTAAIVSSDWLKGSFGFERGFDRYVEVEYGLRFVERVTSELDRILARFDSDRPSFLFVHLYDAHSDPELGGNRSPYLASEVDRLALAAECPSAMCSPAGECATGFLLWANRERQPIPESERACLEETYWAGVRTMDRGLSAIRTSLEGAGLWDEALVVVTSDHGEAFGEHREFIHSRTYWETVRIPLLLKLPSSRAKTGIDMRRAQLSNVVPTIRDFLALGRESDLSLLAPAGDRAALAISQNKHKPERYGVRQDSWFLIRDDVLERTFLFDLDEDPMELVDVSASHPQVVRSLSQELTRSLLAQQQVSDALASSVPSSNSGLDAEALKRLESLGYIGESSN